MKGETLLKILQTLKEQEPIMNNFIPINLTTEMKWKNSLKDSLPILIQKVIDNLNSTLNIFLNLELSVFPQRKLQSLNTSLVNFIKDVGSKNNTTQSCQEVEREHFPTDFIGRVLD